MLCQLFQSFSLSYCANSFVISALITCLAAGPVSLSRRFTNSSIRAAKTSAFVSGFLLLGIWYLLFIKLLYYASSPVK